jgi:peptidoglycan/LPS O-acetylase OafA/YrhL
MTDRRILELDGLRGLSALAVVAAHFFGESQHGFRALAAGWIGVDIFFVLSGFLIGTIILNRCAQPGFFKSFYIRRAARIVPIYFAVVIFALTAAAMTQGQLWSDRPYPMAVYATFTTNIAYAIWQGGGVWLKPTWTLAVEEQFYLILPALIFVTPRKLLPSLLIALWLSATGLRLWFGIEHQAAAEVLLPCRMDLLLAGVLVALLHGKHDLGRHLRALRLMPIAMLVATFSLKAVFGFPAFLIFGPALLSIAIASFILAILNGAPEGGRLRNPLLCWFGQISYGLYLVHQPISGLLHGVLVNQVPDVGSPAQIAVTLLAVAVSIGVAAASWRWFESPILKRAQNSPTAIGRKLPAAA